MNIESIATTLLSEIEELEESLQIVKRRLKQGAALGTHTNVDASKINNLIGKYQLLVEMSKEATKVTEPTK